jgi:3-hydroxyisobutyrate dehydrogenase
VVTALRISTPSILNDSFPAAFALKHLVKDLRLEVRLDSPLIHPLYDSYAAAEQEGLRTRCDGDY